MDEARMAFMALLSAAVINNIKHDTRPHRKLQDFTGNSIDFECAWTKLLVLVLVGCIGNVLIEVPNTNDGVVEVEAISYQCYGCFIV